MPENQIQREQDRRGDLRQSCRPVKRPPPRRALFFWRWGEIAGQRGTTATGNRVSKAARPKQRNMFPRSAAPPASGQEGPGGSAVSGVPRDGLRASRRLKDRLTDTKRRQVDGGIRTEAGSGETPGPDPDGREEAAPRRSCGIKRAGPRRTMAKPPGPLEGIGQESFQNRTLADGVGDATDPVDLAGDHISALGEQGDPSIPTPAGVPV